MKQHKKKQSRKKTSMEALIPEKIKKSLLSTQALIQTLLRMLAVPEMLLLETAL